MGSRQYRWGEHGGVGRISVLQNMENPQKAEELLTEIHSVRSLARPERVRTARVFDETGMRRY
jgi:hypothetical protein